METPAPFLEGIEVLQTCTADAAPTARRAVAFAGQMARLMGAEVSSAQGFDDEPFLTRGKSHLAGPALDWQEAQPSRIVLVATGDSGFQSMEGQSAVVLRASSMTSEATLFANSGLADLLGDPDRAPLIPHGDFGAGTVGYAVFGALCAVACKWRRFGEPETATVEADGVLGWINWKAAMAGDLGKDLRRQGNAAEWPVVECADGHFALVYTERDWPALVKMIGDERLEEERFASFRGRIGHRDAYMSIIREWARALTKVELVALFELHQIPAAPVMTVQDLLNDALLEHRNAFETVALDGAKTCRTPVLPHRVVRRAEKPAANGKLDVSEKLPLAGFRVLDLGIITAGAGVSALLADLGAEVLKIESETYPDPFRAWAGDADSPFFVGNNRNKYGVAIDLKTASGKARFLELVNGADVVVENFRRGVLNRLGLDYETLREQNPDIILASISGVGLTGPGASNSSFGSTLEASSGFSAAVHYKDGLPWITGRNVNYPDQTVVIYAAAAITAALSNPCRGMQLDISQRDVAVFLSGAQVEAASSGVDGAPRSNGQAVPTSEGRWVAMDDASARMVEGNQTSDALLAWCRERNVAAAKVLRGSEMYQANERAGNGVFERSPDGRVVKGFPFQLTRTPMSILRESPQLETSS